MFDILPHQVIHSRGQFPREWHRNVKKGRKIHWNRFGCYTWLCFKLCTQRMLNKKKKQVYRISPCCGSLTKAFPCFDVPAEPSSTVLLFDSFSSQVWACGPVSCQLRFLISNKQGRKSNFFPTGFNNIGSIRILFISIGS